MTNFNHEGRVSLTYKENIPYLIQDGKTFTHAEYNIGTKKWEPEPQLISDDDKYMEMRKEVDIQIKTLMDQLQKILDTTRKLLDEYGSQAMESRNHLKETVQRQNGELMYLREKLKKLEDDEEISKLKDRIKELEEKKKNPVGRPKTKKEDK